MQHCSRRHESDYESDCMNMRISPELICNTVDQCKRNYVSVLNLAHRYEGRFPIIKVLVYS